MRGSTVFYGVCTTRLLLTLALPVLAIVATLDVAFLTFARRDVSVPGPSEGVRSSRDVAQSVLAAALDVRAQLRVTKATGTCRVMLQLDAKLPPALLLSLVEDSRLELDRRVRLTPSAGGYEGHCGLLPAGNWHLELADDSGSWNVRGDVSGILDGTRVRGRPGRD